MNEPIPMTFCFMFPDEGLMWEKDMTRNQLLHVINHLIAEKNWLMAEARKPKYWWQQSDRSVETKGE